MNAVAGACVEMGFKPVNCGYIPSPAVALFGLKHSMPTIMVTGSHIPDDRNGIKFNTKTGEILKHDEKLIRSQLVDVPVRLFSNEAELINKRYLPSEITDANEHYIQRFTNFFPKACLEGQNIGLYEHSSVSRDCLKVILERLGAKVTSLGRTNHFVSVDTEAIRPEDVVLAKEWSEEYKFDCIISTDGDGDRPLISDEKGNWLRGDVAGILCARYLNADIVVTPVSSNSAVEKSEWFEQVIRTRIGSPYVIEAMQQASSDDKTSVGYEANGGFLQHTPISVDDRTLSPLATRDAAIVPIAILLLASKREMTVSELLATLPQRYTFSDRLKDFPTKLSQTMLSKIVEGNEAANFETIRSFFPGLSEPVKIDETDGIRITLATDEIIHLRPSGNAPELRCYTEADSEVLAQELNSSCIKIMKTWL